MATSFEHRRKVLVTQPGMAFDIGMAWRYSNQPDWPFRVPCGVRMLEVREITGNPAITVKVVGPIPFDPQEVEGGGSIKFAVIEGQDLRFNAMSDREGEHLVIIAIRGER